MSERILCVQYKSSSLSLWNHFKHFLYFTIKAEQDVRKQASLIWRKPNCHGVCFSWGEATSRMHLFGFSQLSSLFGLGLFFLMAMQEWQDTSVISPQTFCKSLLATRYMTIHIKKNPQEIRDLCDGSVKRSINWASFKLQNSTLQDWHSSTPHLLPRLSSYSLSVVITLWSNNCSLTVLP